MATRTLTQIATDAEEEEPRDFASSLDAILSSNLFKASSHSLKDLLADRLVFVPASRPDTVKAAPYKAINVGPKPVPAVASVPPQPVASTSKLPALAAAAPSATNVVTSHLSTRWPQGITQPNSGFGNLGNTCYLNATLQALCHLPPLVYALLAGKEHTCDACGLKAKNRFCALCELAELMNAGFKAKRKQNTPTRIVSEIRRAFSSMVASHSPDMLSRCLHRNRKAFSSGATRRRARVLAFLYGSPAELLPGEHTEPVSDLS